MTALKEIEEYEVIAIHPSIPAERAVTQATACSNETIRMVTPCEFHAIWRLVLETKTWLMVKRSFPGVLRSRSNMHPRSQVIENDFLF
jgi:hypothetical protein